MTFFCGMIYYNNEENVIKKTTMENYFEKIQIRI